jgi:hypothetical protein
MLYYQKKDCDFISQYFALPHMANFFSCVDVLFIFSMLIAMETWEHGHTDLLGWRPGRCFP